MKQNLEKTLALLSRTPAALDALLRGLPEEWTHRNEGERTWSVFDVVGHVIHCEQADWMPRARVMLQAADRQGDGPPFPPFDRFGHLRFVEGKSLAMLLDEFAGLRARNLAEMRGWNLSDEQMGFRGRHPGLGPVTLSQLLGTWGVHDLTHLHQMTRVMAHQYQEAVGPFQRFLGVLQCGGHSATA